MAQSGPVLEQHVAKVEERAIHTSFLGKAVQNELMECICEKSL